MNKKKIIILSIISILVIVCLYVSISYGYYVISSNEQVEMNTATITPECVGLKLSNNEAFTLNDDYAVPITDEQFLNSKEETKNMFKYSFTVTSDCAESKTLKIGVAPLDGYTLKITNLKYVLVEKKKEGTAITKNDIKSFSDSEAKTLPEDIKEYLQETIKNSAVSVYNIGDVTLDNKSSKSYDLYMWVSSTANNDTMNQSFSAAIVLDNVEETSSPSVP